MQVLKEGFKPKLKEPVEWGSQLPILGTPFDPAQENRFRFSVRDKRKEFIALLKKHRLLHVHAQGGAGKTHFAVEVTHALPIRLRFWLSFKNKMGVVS